MHNMVALQSLNDSGIDLVIQHGPDRGVDLEPFRAALKVAIAALIDAARKGGMNGALVKTALQSRGDEVYVVVYDNAPCGLPSSDHSRQELKYLRTMPGIEIHTGRFGTTVSWRVSEGA